MQGDQPMSGRPVPPGTQCIDDRVPSHYHTGSRDAFFLKASGMTFAYRIVPCGEPGYLAAEPLFRKWIMQVSTPYPGFYVATWQHRLPGGQCARVGTGGVALDHDGGVRYVIRQPRGVRYVIRQPPL